MKCTNSKKAGTMKNKQSKHVVTNVLFHIVKAAPLWILADCLVMILSSTTSAFNTVVLQYLFDTITEVIQGTSVIKKLILVAIIVTAFQVINELLNSICNFIADPAGMRVNQYFYSRIHKKLSRVSAYQFENKQFLDTIEKAKQGAGNAVNLYHSVSTLFTFYLPFFTVMSIYLWSLRPLLLITLLFIFIPLFISLMVRNYVFSKLIDESVPIERKMNYFEDTMYKQKYVKEVRTLGVHGMLNRLYKESTLLFCKKKWKANRKVQIIEVLLRILTLMGYLGVLWLLFDSLIRGYISVGAFAAVFSSINTMIAFMNDMVSNYLSTLFDNFGALRNYVDFMAMEIESNDATLSTDSAVELSNVSFKYPESDTTVISNLSLNIKKGELIALVGTNGAGKSTLSKLILGLYKPDTGEIKYNSEFKNSENQITNVSAVFQNYQHYNFPLKDNVVISQFDKEDDSYKDYLEKSGFEENEEIIKNPDVILSREFDGIDLSGGQWQRIAMARGLYRNSDLIVFDEPTSAIDPIEESKLYNRFKEISKGKTAVLVTHRLGSARIADRIIVLDKGEICEEGTHEQLLNNNGIYEKMFKEQAQWYVEFESV